MDSQAVKIDLRSSYGGFFRRLVALWIDFVIFATCGWFFGPVLSVLASFLYYPVFQSSPLMATPGQALLGLRVIHEESLGRIPFKQAALRHLIHFVSAGAFCLGYLVYFFTPKKQTLHDLVAKTVVTREEPPEINYFYAWLDEVRGLFKV